MKVGLLHSFVQDNYLRRESGRSGGVMCVSKDVKSTTAETSLASLAVVNFFNSAGQVAGTHCIDN